MNLRSRMAIGILGLLILSAASAAAVYSRSHFKRIKGEHCADNVVGARKAARAEE